ncbi:MAG TPA: hypothetical protein VK102_12095 [Sphingobacterium sp.]|nr:hypothetical protein [Sphingobacterium sp.]
MTPLAGNQPSERDRMHHIIDIADDKKVKAMLTLFQDIEQENEFSEYPDNLKKQLDSDFKAYKSGDKTYSEQEVKAHNSDLLKSLGLRK